MYIEILHSDVPQERERWIQVWGSGSKEPFTHPAYVELFCGSDDRAVCAHLDAEGAQFLYAFILRQISGLNGKTYFDITTPYGYGGAYRQGHPTASQTGHFWKEFEAWATEVGVVSEFVRMDLDSKRLVDYPGELHFRSNNIVRPLSMDRDALWEDFDKKVRKNFRKAERSGVVLLHDPLGERLDDFLGIYESTLNRRDAAGHYYFDREFFRTIIRSMPECFEFFHAVYEDKIVSTELVLVSKDRMYSYLGGTDSTAYDVRPNDYLKVKMMEWGVEQRKSYYVLGGGAKPEDGIERYKRSFAPNGIQPFYTGQRVLLQKAYAELTARRTRELKSTGAGRPPENDYFPAYRAPLRRSDNVESRDA